MPASAATRVFNTTELLEGVLLELSFLDLFVIQRVSQTFRETIHGSVKLKQHMFLESPPLRVLDGTVLVNPLVASQRHFLPTLDMEPQAGESDYHIYFGSATALQNGGNSIEVALTKDPIELQTSGLFRGTDARYPHALPIDSHSSWRRMHVTLPPPGMFSTDFSRKSVTVTSHTEFRSWSWLRHTVYHRVHCNNARLGDVLDVLANDSSLESKSWNDTLVMHRRDACTIA